jgi:hypothetical protein
VNGDQFAAAIGAVSVAELPLAVEPLADERIRSALDGAGVVLFGEIHGVYENPLAVYTLMRRFELSCLGLEWPPELQPVIASFLTSGRLDFPSIAQSADGRITAGHFAVLRALSQEGRLNRLVLFAPAVAYPKWSDRDRAMASYLLARVGKEPVLVAVGNLHSRLLRHRHGEPMGTHISRERPGAVEISVEYAGGAYFNIASRRFASPLSRRSPGQALTLTWSKSRAVLTVPEAHEAAVPAG